MSQPNWKYIANLGDVTPLEYGGAFVYEDTTGAYAPEVEYLIAPEEENGKYLAYRFSVENCTFLNGILSDNQFHPECPAWFASPDSRKAERPYDTTYLSSIAETMGMEEEELREMFLSPEVLTRAHAWIMVGEYHGFDNLDSYPLTLTREEAEKRYAGLV